MQTKKASAEKDKRTGLTHWACPTCGKQYLMDFGIDHCRNCNQKLRWSNE